MTFDEWWDTTKTTATPETFAGWEQSCRQAWNKAMLVGHGQCIDWLHKEHQRRKHRDNFAGVMAKQMQEDLKP